MHALLLPTRVYCVARNVQDLDELTRQTTLAEIYLIALIENHAEFNKIILSKHCEQIKTNRKIAELYEIISEIKNMVAEK